LLFKNERWIWVAVSLWGTLPSLLWAQKASEIAVQAVPFQEELILDSEKDAAAQVRILRRACEENPKDPQNPRRFLTIAFLSEEVLGDLSQAAAAYEEYANRARGSRFALHARFRAAELLYQQSQKGVSVQERQYLYGQVAKLETLISQATQPRRSLTGSAVPPQGYVWEKNSQGQWIEIPPAEVYKRALQRIDEVSRSKWSYQAMDLLFRAMGGRPGRSHFLALLMLALILKLVLHPLNRKQYTSMAKMQELQPQIKKIQERYKDNPQKLQMEMMKVYREHGVNPMSGCFPMLIQLPVLFSVYGGIRAYAYQFNQAPAVLGINLGQPNLFLLVLYTISMFVQQKLMMLRNPQATLDPQQEQMQKMMQFMPLMFTVMMWMYGWPSAFYLYWLAFNVLSTAEQWFIIGKLQEPAGSGTRNLPGPPSASSRSGRDGQHEGQLSTPQPESSLPAASRPRRRPLSVVSPSGDKESRKRRVARRR
jgi:YidC/Oxa1 family membrane protein insertase